MKTAIILPGMPSEEEYFNPDDSAQSNKHWLPWIQRQLILNKVLAQAIELPSPYQPVYKDWEGFFNQFKVDEDTMLIGHSCGAGFLVRWLSENKIKVGKVALIAPFLDPDHDEIQSDFFDFDIDSELSERTRGTAIFYSTDDDQEILTSVSQIKERDINVEIKEFTDKGHFVFGSMKTEKFPELLKWLLSV